MKIGLVRHFKVIQSVQTMLTSREFAECIQQYDVADVTLGTIELGGVNWERCYSSDLPRALKTAHSTGCQIVTTKLLREVPISPIFNTNRKLPLFVWLSLGRIAWAFSHKSQPETRIQTVARVKSFIAQILSQPESNILLVSHGVLMAYMQKELISQGFSGDKFIKARNGTLYVFQK